MHDFFNPYEGYFDGWSTGWPYEEDFYYGDVYDEDVWLGWSPPPHPIDVMASFDPSASHRDQARSILNDYLYDNDTRDWADDGTVKKAFGTQGHPIHKKEDFDPSMLIQAYENKQHPVWAMHGGRNSWQQLDKAVEAAIARRSKLGPLPKASYGSEPAVIYYYDHDHMKKISYPRMSIPAALNPNNLYWWRWEAGDTSKAGRKAGVDGIHTWESQDPRSIAAERAAPGFPGATGNLTWHGEGFDAGKDIAGNVGVISSTMMQVIGAVLEVVPGIGTAIGSTMIMAAPYVQQIANVVDVSIAGGDNATALAGIGKMVVQAAAMGLKYGAGVDIPPAAVTAIGVTIDGVAKSVDAAQKKKLDWAGTWDRVAKKASSFGKVDDNAAHVIATVLGEDVAGKVFLAGHQAGKLAPDLDTISAIAKIVQPMGAFTDPKIENLFLLGAGMGHLQKVQEQSAPSVSSSSHATRGSFWTTSSDEFIGAEGLARRSDLEAFCHLELAPRYGLDLVGLDDDLVEEIVGAAGYDPLVEYTQRALNAFYHQRLTVNGVLDARTIALLKSFQLAFHIGAGDGIPTTDTLSVLEAAVTQKWPLPVVQGNFEGASYFVGAGSGKGVTFYDPDLAQFGNAISPFQQMPNFESAHLATMRPLEDRYDSRYIDQPTMADFISDDGEPIHVGDDAPIDYGPLSRGCPQGTWWDPIGQVCRPRGPLPTPHPYPVPPPRY